jgi:hypothetical protein
MSASPPPEEREKADADARAKEQAEQAALPYKWDQTIKDLDITITIDAKYKGKDLDVKISRNALKAGIKGQEPFIDVRSGASTQDSGGFRSVSSCTSSYSRAPCIHLAVVSW